MKGGQGKHDFTKTNLFYCPIYKIRIDPNSYDKEKILKDIKYNKSLKNRRNDTEENFANCDIHHSYHDFDNEDFRPINYDKLTAEYQEIFQRFFDKEVSTREQFDWEFGIVNYTAMTEGQYFPSHFHPTDDFAAVHYLNFKDDHAPTMFLNPATFVTFLREMRPEMYNIMDKKVPDNSYLWESCLLSIEEDDMIIFPASLKHEIKVQGPTKEPRITIATNLKILSQEK